MAVLRSDNFNRANGSLGTPSDAGSDWVNPGGISVTNNGAALSYAPSVPPGVAAWLEAGNADVAVEATMVNNWTYGPGIVARATDINNFVFLQLGSSQNVRICEMQSGAVTQLADCGVSAAANDVFRLEASGSTVTAFRNGTQIGQATGVTLNQTTTTHGIWFGDSDGSDGRGKLDDFSVSGLVTVPPATWNLGPGLAAANRWDLKP